MPNISLIKIQTLSLNQIPYSPSKIKKETELTPYSPRVKNFSNPKVSNSSRRF